jgi:RimJ/RimL family protein N-acetyltransferase
MNDAVVLPTLQGPRVRLRTPVPADVPALFAVYSDPQVMRYWSNAPYTAIEQAQTKLAELDRGNRTGDFCAWAIAHNHDDILLGTCSLFEINPSHRRASLGYALGSAHWNQGLALEATRLAVQYAFGVLQLHKLEADVDPRNASSLRLLDRLGFAREGLLRERWHVAGETQDSVICGLLARDYAASASIDCASVLTAPA